MKELYGTKSTPELGALQLIFSDDHAAGLRLQPLERGGLAALRDDEAVPRGLGSLPRLASAYGHVTHDFYESLNEFLALEGEGASAAAAKAHAKTTAKATAKAGAAVMSSVGSRLGANFGMFGRALNQRITGKMEELNSMVK